MFATATVVERPKRIFVERGVPLLQADFDTVSQQVVLPEKVSFLDKIVQCAIVTL